MPMLKFKIKNIEFEYIGEHGDMIKFIQELMTSSFNMSTLEKTSTKVHRATSVQSHEEPKITSEEKSLLPLPSNEDVLAYIISKPDYQHTLYDIQKHFFGCTFITTDPKTVGMYLKTLKQLKQVRKEIEKRYGGKFEEKRGKKRLTYYSFKKEEKPASM